MNHTQSSKTQRATAALALLASLALAGCRQDMQDQPKFFPQRGTNFYADGRSVRPQEEGTVARQQGDPTSYLLTGMIDGKEGDGLPLPLTPELIARGQERYNIYCTPCHSRTGYGHGMIVQRGYEASANLHSTRLRDAPLGHFFTVMTNGFGAMPEYKAQVTPEDRWAIAAYIRALQLSQNAKDSDAPSPAAIKPLTDIATTQGMPAEWANTRYWTSSVANLPTYTTGEVASLHPGPVPGVPSGLTAATGPLASGQLAPGPTPKPGAANTAATGSTGPVKPAAPAAPPKPKANAAAGKQVYLDNCSICHQDTLEGRPPKIPAILNIVARTGEDHVRTTIHEGKPDARPMMPSFAEKLTDAQVDDLIAFLKTGKPAAE